MSQVRTTEEMDGIEAQCSALLRRDLNDYDRDFVENLKTRVDDWGIHVVISARQEAHFDRIKRKHGL